MSAENERDAAFDTMGTIPNAMGYLKNWEKDAAAYRASGINIEADIPYGPGRREVFDMVSPDAAPNGLVIFVHGGFWMRLSKDFWTHFAEGARASGHSMALPSYTLAPDARIREMTLQVARAIEAAARRVRGPVRLVGHSAGGHLVTRMLCEDAPLCEALRRRIAHVLSISGLHDLRPLLLTKMNDVLNLDKAEALQESPALRRPSTSARVTALVGGGEMEEFIRQTECLADAWAGEGVEISSRVSGRHHHFSVLDDLRVPQSGICPMLFG